MQKVETTSGNADWADRHIRVAADFILDTYPAPPESFRRADVVDGRYHVQPAVWELAQETVASRTEPLPCGHAGLCNRGDAFECGYEGCDEVFDRNAVDWGDGDD